MQLRRTIIASIIMIGTLVLLGFMGQGKDVLPLKPFSTFPKQIGEWIGKEGYFDKEIYDLLGVHDSILCNYLTPTGNLVQLYVGYYKSQRQGSLIHSPKNCLPGSGWKIVQTSIEELPSSASLKVKTKATRLILQKGQEKQVVLYWFQSRGRYVASEYWDKIYLVMDSIIRQRTDEAFVRLIASVQGEDVDKTTQILKNFSTLLLPILTEYIPS